MKQHIMLVICLCLMVLFPSCAAPQKTSPAPSFPDKDITATPTIQAVDQSPSQSTNHAPELLPLENFREHPVTYDFEEDSILNTKSIDLNHSTLSERNQCPYSNEAELDTLVQFIRDQWSIELDDSWKITVHYYDAEKTVGFVQFMYTVGQINTNRSIVFTINENKYDTVYYKCLTGNVDKADLTSRMDTFKHRYIQEQRQLQDGEIFHQEQTTFTYYIHSDTFVYFYAYFFQYDMGVINNDWGTERIIDKNGYAVAMQ